MLFHWNFPLCIGYERNGMIIFIFSLSYHFPTYFGLKWIRNGIFLIFFVIFMEFSITQRVGTKQNNNFYFCSFSDFTNQNAWSEAIMVSFNFLNFFAIFLEFSITRRIGMEQKDNLYFLSFTAFLQRILAGNEATMVFFNFLNFFVIFLVFSITHRAGTKRNNNFCFFSFSTSSNLFWLEIRQ